MSNYILLIDDNSIDNFFHQRVLRKFNSELSVITYTSPFNALNFLNEKIPGEAFPSIIFLDVNMPEMTGWQFLEQLGDLKKLEPVRFIVMSSEKPDAEKIALYQDSVCFVHKPLTLEVIERLFEKCE